MDARLQAVGVASSTLARPPPPKALAEQATPLTASTRRRMPEAATAHPRRGRWQVRAAVAWVPQIATTTAATTTTRAMTPRAMQCAVAIGGAGGGGAAPSRAAITTRRAMTPAATTTSPATRRAIRAATPAPTTRECATPTGIKTRSRRTPRASADLAATAPAPTAASTRWATTTTTARA